MNTFNWLLFSVNDVKLTIRFLQVSESRQTHKAVITITNDIWRFQSLEKCLFKCSVAHVLNTYFYHEQTSQVSEVNVKQFSFRDFNDSQITDYLLLYLHDDVMKWNAE